MSWLNAIKGVRTIHEVKGRGQVSWRLAVVVLEGRIRARRHQHSCTALIWPVPTAK